MAIATDAQPPEMERSMWPSTKQALMRADQRRQRVQPALGADLEWDNTFADGQTFEDLMKFSKIAISHQESLARLWKNKSTSAVGLLREQLDSLQQRRIESERKKKEILDEHAAERFYSFTNGDKEMLDPVNIGEGFLCNSEPASSCSSVQLDSASSVGEDDENNSTDYWRVKAKALDNLLSESLNREESLHVQLRDSIAGLPSRLSNELREQFKRFDNFLRLTLRKAPVVLGYQDTELRYRFVHNAFPTLTEEEVIGKTDEEICQGMGVAELMEFKRQVIRTKVPDKQEIKFNTNMFGLKTFMVAAEPVLDTNDVCVGLNYLAMDVTLQVAKREKLASVQEEEAVQRAMESELNKTIYMTEETMRAKQMLTTMSHEIRSPLSGVISMASILARTPLNEDQKLKVEFMIKSGNDVLELINDILDLSKVEAGAMTFEAKKFRPREVVKHVVQMASASVAAQNKIIQVDSDVSEDVPLEVVGDVLRIRQVLTNLVSNSVKFTHKGKVSIVVRIAPPPFKFRDHMKLKQTSALQSVERSTLPVPMTAPTSLEAPHILDKNGLENTSELVKDLMWIEFQIVDTGIGISESAIPTLFKRYSQASTTHARKYGGTGLGLHICKQLVELMGGSINVLSKEKDGSVFSFKLPLRAAVPQGSSNAISIDEDQEDADAPVMKEMSPRPQTRRKVNHLSHATTEHSPVVAPSEQCCPRRLDGEDHRSNSCHGGRVRKCESHMRSQGSNSRKTERTHAAPEPVLPAAKAVKYSRPFRILVAEDDPVNVKVATQMMIALSHELKVVHNGADAVLAVQQGTYDVVLMDVHMPVMGGLEATQHIRKYEKAMNQQVATGAYDMSLLRRRTRIPIIAMTADALADNIEECAKHGMDDFIAKPVNLEKLEELLIQYVASLDYESM